MSAVNRGTTKNIILGIFILYMLECITCSNRTRTYIRISGVRKQPVFQTVTSKSALSCSVSCTLQTDCYVTNYNKGSYACEFVSFPLTGENIDGNWNAYASKSEWVLMFRGTAGNGLDMYDAWVNGINVVTDDADCLDLGLTSCVSHYRSTKVNDWSTLGIKKVRFSIYKDGEEKHFILFDGTGTDHINWFQSEKILKTSWPNLFTDTFNYFSISGFAPARRFHINTHHGGCGGDKGYLIVVTSKYFICNYDDLPPYPVILYAEGTTPVIYETASDVGQADFIAIHAKMSYS